MSGLCRIILVIAIVSAASLLLSAGSAWAQTPSTLDTMRIVNVTIAHPGDTVNVDLYIRNADTLGAFTFRVRYDPSVISPLLDTVITGVDTVIAAERSTEIRGTAFSTVSPAMDADIWSEGLPSSGVYKLLALDQAPKSAPDIFLPGAGATVRMRWLIRSTASPQTASIAFENDPVYPQTDNTFAQISGLLIWRPVLINGTITITTGGGNNPPSITSCPAPVTVSAGQLVQFAVPATDPDGNTVSLLATNLPTGASFSPSNPVVGTGSATGNFSWVPTSSQTGNFTVSFQATDQPGGLSSGFCNVTITVTQPTGNVAPVVICPSNTSYTVDQGQEVSFNISASDANNDPIQLYPVNAPTGYSLLPANPVSGTGSASGTFKWTPSFTQSGIFSVGFQAKDTANNLSVICNVTITVNQVQVDRLFSTSAPGQEAQGGVPGTGGVVIPINFLNVKASYGVQFDFVYDATIFTPSAIQTSDRLIGFTVYDNMGTTAGRIRIVAFSLTGQSVANGTTTVLFNVIGSINPAVAPGAYPVMFEDAWGSIDPDPTEPSASIATTDGVIMVDNLGDANLDTRIDVADIVTVVGYILGTFPFNPRQFGAANTNADNFVDVFDLQAIINHIFGAPVVPAPGVPPVGGTPATVQFIYDRNDGPSGAFRLSADLPSDVAGAQVELAYDPATVTLGSPEALAVATNMQLRFRDDGQGHLRALLFNLMGGPPNMRTGRHDVLRIPLSSAPALGEPTVRLQELKLAAPDASQIEVSGVSPVPRSFVLDQNYPNPFNPTTTIAFTLGDLGSSGPSVAVYLVVYNLLGQQVKTLFDGTLGPGRYEYIWDGTDQAGQTMASGLYFYRLTTGGNSETKKMVLMK
ncbi:MAG: T9SS type A sorting domain-containing protein [candidate division Zixibacteria bacterium]|nr:T9SS type A sorting domain-containing protein [candidate division Zixibacteria bacterium]